MARRLILPAWLARLALAYLLVVQGVLGAAASGFHAPRAVAAAGGVLCAGDTGPSDAPAAHEELCCVLGCVPGHASPLLPSAHGGSLAAERVAQALAFPLPARLVAAGARPAAFHARGPPRAG